VHVALERIEEAPQRFPVALRDIRKARVRRFPYVVYYVILPDAISVIAIMHGRRDPRRWQQRRVGASATRSAGVGGPWREETATRFSGRRQR
jgi:hypothetical protein